MVRLDFVTLVTFNQSCDTKADPLEELSSLLAVAETNFGVSALVIHAALKI